ncbi:baseplate J/gp47 family protein [Hansschlegelia zhihuaiae]|uniref:Uncharacterized protein n=1 Tax=Hansschlegelia zhihuaiae TaxID=405005 RepID=A0A4Q0M4P2_9HYPH|nr:baseplate J/gp47 family protein [Hansschlegelia zhihuaiae]RXF67679.1 hypothetical protein EK403_20975 [Hansschlegelia zhihuaiae]
MAGSEIRSLGELSTQARGYFTAAVGGAAVGVWPNSFTVTAKVLALISHEHDRRRAFLHDQIFVSTASDAALERHGFEDGLTRRPARPARGAVTVPAPHGLEVSPGLRFVRADGAVYVARSGTAWGETVTLVLTAEEPGAAANAPAGTELSLSAGSVAPGGLGSVATVGEAGLAGGSDVESLEAFRERVLDRRRNPPAGGSAGDYARWTREALAEVRETYVEAFTADDRAVWLQFTVTDQPNGIPSGVQVNAVQAYLDDPLRKPVGARIYVSAPTPVAVDVEIEGVPASPAAIRTAIAAELAAQFLDRAEPGRPSAPFRLRRSVVSAAISRVVDEGSFDLAAPAASVDFVAGEMPVLGAVTFV